MVSVQSGNLRQRITLQSASQEQDVTGQPLTTAVAFATCWAEVKPMSGNEIYRAQQYTDEATIQVTIRYRRGVDASMTILYTDQDGDHTYEILAILNEMQQNVYLILLCKERQT